MQRWTSCRHHICTILTNPIAVDFQIFYCFVKTHPKACARYCTSTVSQPIKERSQSDVLETVLHSSDKYVNALQKCRKLKDVAQAKRIYEHIHGSTLDIHRIVGNQIVQVLVESGALADAQCVFGRLASRNVLSWTALISGYVDSGQEYHAFSVYYRMLEDNVNPSSYTLVALLRACTKLRDMQKGKEFHAQAVQKGFETDFYVASTLVDMYAKFGLLSHAREAFGKLSTRDAVLWNALITGYSENGLCEEALHCYKEMQLENLSSTVVTFLGLLKACCILGSIEKGMELHRDIARKAFDKDDYISSSLVGLYAKCGSMLDAESVFDGLSSQNSVLWNTLLAGYADHGHGKEVLKRLEQMERAGISCDVVTFTYGIKSCGILSNMAKNQEMHTEVVAKGVESDIVLGSALLDTYSKCGFLLEAQEVFNKLPARDVISWSALIAGYAQHGSYQKALESFNQMQSDKVVPNAVTLACVLKACINSDGLTRGKQIHKEVAEDGFDLDLLVSTSLIDMYGKHGLLSEAQDIFDALSNRDIVLFNTLLAGYAENGVHAEVLSLLENVKMDGVSLDAATYTSAVKACGNMKDIEKGQDINHKIVLLGYESDVLISSLLIEMYVKCTYLLDARNIFSNLSDRDVVAWNVLIVGLVEHGCNQEAVSYYEHMGHDNVSADSLTFAGILKGCSNEGDIFNGQVLHTKAVHKGYEGDPYVGSSLIDLYAKCGLLPEASAAFEAILMKDDVAWNAILTAYVDNGYNQEALACLQRMQSENYSPSVVTLLCLLKACGTMGAINRLQEMHIEVMQKGFEKGLLVGNTLVDTYGKCGFLQEALKVFDTLCLRDVASWNAMIKGSGMNSKGGMPMKYLKGLLEAGLKPDATTFTCLLTACSQASLLVEGQDFFEVMGVEFGIVPAVDHCVCMVDLLARSGCLYEAENMIQILPRSPNTSTWTALLSASKTFQESEVGSRCFHQLVS